MNEKILIYKEYKVEIIYQPHFDDKTPKSKQYLLIISKDNREYIHRYGFTNSGANAFYKNWIDKHTNN